MSSPTSPPFAPRRTCSLYKIPVEVRLMVYKYVIFNCWEGRSPSLIKALRADKNLYHEALDAFYRNNIYRLWWRSRINARDLSSSSGVPYLSKFLSTIRHIKIEIPNRAKFVRSNWAASIPTTTKWTRAYTKSALSLPHLSNVQTLHLSLGCEDECSRPSYVPFFQHVIHAYNTISRFGHLQVLAIDLDYRHTAEHHIYISYLLRQVVLTTGVVWRPTPDALGTYTWAWYLPTPPLPKLAPTHEHDLVFSNILNTDPKTKTVEWHDPRDLNQVDSTTRYLNGVDVNDRVIYTSHRASVLVYEPTPWQEYLNYAHRMPFASLWDAAKLGSHANESIWIYGYQAKRKAIDKAEGRKSERDIEARSLPYDPNRGRRRMIMYE